MNGRQPADGQAPDPEVFREIAAELQAELERIQAQMRELTKAHQRALALRMIYDRDPLTRERFAMLHTNIEEYPGRLAALREDERLLTGWLERCRDMLRATVS